MNRHEAMIREAIGGRLRLICEASGLTLSDFARRFGVTPQALSNYMSGLRPTPHELIYHVCKAFGQSPADFYPPILSSIPATPRAAGSAPEPTVPGGAQAL